jgi:hypothetical protein
MEFHHYHGELFRATSAGVQCRDETHAGAPAEARHVHPATAPRRALPHVRPGPAPLFTPPANEVPPNRRTEQWRSHGDAIGGRNDRRRRPAIGQSESRKGNARGGVIGPGRRSPDRGRRRYLSKRGGPAWPPWVRKRGAGRSSRGSPATGG